MKIAILGLFLSAFIFDIEGCTLCHKHIPPVPKPLDEFRLPSIEFLLKSKDTIIQFCNDTSEFELTSPCRTQIEQLFCGVKDIWDHFTDTCPGAEDPFKCKECSWRNAGRYMKSGWIITWFDSIGKMPSGISDGNYHWLGDYEECENLAEENLFDGRYCMANFELKADVKRENEQCSVDTNYEGASIKLGICTPAQCTEKEMAKVIQTFAPMPIELNCEPPALWSKGSIAFSIIIGIWIAVIVIASVLDQTDACHHGKIAHFVDAVSIKKNIRRSLSTRRGNDSMHALEGIQFISVVMLVIGNVFNIMAPYMENASFLYSFNKDFRAQPIINYLYHVDGLLVLSALATTLRLHIHVNSFKNMLQLVLDRAVRIFPMYAFILLFTTLLFVRVGSGPMWSHSAMADRCAREFWKELLFINNFFNYNETCLDGSYLIANEAQLFLILMVLLYLTKNHRKIAIGSTIALISISIIYTLITTIAKQTPPTLIPTHLFVTEFAAINYINNVLIKPYSHAASYFIGFLFSFYIQSNHNVSQSVYLGVYAILGLIAVFVIWAPFPFISTSITSWNVFYPIYATVSPPLWALFCLVLIYTIDRKTSFIGVFLSWRIFHPLSKLSYVIFLISEPVALYFFSSLHRPFYGTGLAFICTGVGTLVVSIVLSTIVDVAISRPIRNLFKFSDRRRHLSTAAHTQQNSLDLGRLRADDK
uniref:NRF domain-containing protein n=1 Tax=Rhabditophanes sp. KR3021 TaxID=114890 RepID=A0AC35TMK9_9BILA